jgi:hypothetical protein
MDNCADMFVDLTKNIVSFTLLLTVHFHLIWTKVKSSYEIWGLTCPYKIEEGVFQIFYLTAKCYLSTSQRKWTVVVLLA